MDLVYRTERNPFSDADIELVYSSDGGYVGTPEFAKLLIDRGIAPELATPEHKTCSVGFCAREKKWYGWSHRAMHGFGVGSEVKRGDCAYVADTPEGLIEDRAEFFRDISEESARQKAAECQVLPDRSGIRILHSPILLPIIDVADVDDALDGLPVATQMVDITADDPVTIVKCGRGEWVAETLDDARQMACDFADGVS